VNGILLVEEGQRKYGALHGQNVPEEMERRCGLKTIIVNDANAFAIGVGEDYNEGRIGVVTLGTGLGSGFLIDGELYESGPGVHPSGDIWNLPYKTNPVTGKDWLEEFISKRAIMSNYTSMSGQILSVKEIADLARASEQW